MARSRQSLRLQRSHGDGGHLVLLPLPRARLQSKELRLLDVFPRLLAEQLLLRLSRCTSQE